MTADSHRTVYIQHIAQKCSTGEDMTAHAQTRDYILSSEENNEHMGNV